MQSTISRPVTAQASTTSFTTDSGFSLGQRVRHQKFGEGVILNYEGSGEMMRLQVNFANHGVKWLVSSFANLEPA